MTECGAVEPAGDNPQSPARFRKAWATSDGRRTGLRRAPPSPLWQSRASNQVNHFFPFGVGSDRGRYGSAPRNRDAQRRGFESFGG